METVVAASTHSTPSVEVPQSVLDTVTDFYQRGLYLQAYAAATAHSPLRSWRNTAARLIGGRLAMNIGAPRIGSLMHVTAWRQDRSHPEARYYYARRLAEYSGPFKAWRFMQESGDLPDAPTEIRADWYAFHAYVIGRLRDFDQAEEWMKRADALSAGNAWVACERSYLFELEDRYPDALAAAKRSLEIRAWFRPGVQQTAHLLQLLDRDHEALELLTEASRHIESASVVSQMAALQTELQLYEEARASYERCRELSPLQEEGAQISLDMLRSDAAYYCGDLAKATEHAKAAAKSPFYAKFAERLSTQAVDVAAAPSAARRVVLNVGFVRQHHMTCAPATLSALSRYWSRPYDHLEVAEQICYDGTPAHSERNWAKKSGWIVREFTMTWENARALIDRGIPFTLTTIEPTSGHLQAVIGYDELRGTLLVRDPYERHFREFIIESTLARYRATGPRGMALVPPDKAELLTGVTLDDEALYDELYTLNSALETHDRARAWQAYQAMEARDCNHRLTLQARRTIAGYDADYTTMLACSEAALKMTPGDAGLMLQKLSCLRYLARRDQRLDLLRTLCRIKRSSEAKAGSTSPTLPAVSGDNEQIGFDPVFWLYYAQELSADARNDSEALYYVRKCIRYRPFDGAHYYTLANILWAARKFVEGTAAYRIASCLAVSDERYARAYFIAAQHQKTQASALNFVEQRFERQSKISSSPARTLYWTLESLDRQNDAFRVLEDAIKLRPDDGEFMLFAANAFEAYGRHARAAELLAAAEKRSHRTHWLRTRATMARNSGNLLEARGYWNEVVTLEPLAFDAHRSLTQLIAELEGRPAAHEYLKKCCERFPYNFPMHQLRTEWLRDDDPVAAEQVVRHLLELDPDDAWTRRELAGALMRQRRFDEGLREAEIALQLDPSNTFGICVRARLLLGLKDREKAREAYRAAIRISIDSHFAIRELLACCDSVDEKRADLKFIHEQLVQQVNFGDGLLAYRSEASDTLDAESLLQALQSALAARQDLWHAWSAVIQQLTHMNRIDEALTIAKEATARFPLIGHLWHDLAAVHRSKQDFDARIAALQTACEVDPTESYPARELADAFAARGDLPKARALLEQTISRAPLDNYTHGCLADIEWRLGEKETALKRLQHALKLSPGYSWAWTTLREWGTELNRPELAADMARELTRHRPADTKAWMTLARTLDGPKHRAERLSVADKVIELDPYHTEAHNLRATTLYYLKRLDEARAACRPAVFGSKIPTMLLGREAWIEAESGDKRKGIELLNEALARDPVYTWGWARVADWAESIEDHATCLDAAERLVQLAPQDAPPYGNRANARLLAKKDRDGAKTDYRRALELQPDYRYAALGLFDVLFEDNDLAGARSVLESIEKHLPNDAYVLSRFVALLNRAKDVDGAKAYFAKVAQAEMEDAWPIDNAFSELNRDGLRSDAMALLRDATAAKPDLYFTWQKLAEEAEEKDTDTYQEAAEAMVRLRPNHPTGYAFLANAKKRRGNPNEAAELFKKALTIAPDYRYAARNLFDLQLEADKLSDASATFEQLGKCGKDEFYELRGIRLGMRKKDQAFALDHFRALCKNVNAPKERLQSALELFSKCDAADAAHGVLDDLLDQSLQNKHVAELWVESLPKKIFSSRSRVALERFEQFKGDELGRRALANAYLEVQKQEKAKNAVRSFLSGHRAFMVADNSTWGVAGYVLSSLRQDHDCAEWLGDWRNRKDIRPWILLNLVLSLRRLNRADEAHEAGEAALKLESDHCTDMHTLWIAADALLARDYPKSRELTQRVSRNGLSNYYKFMFDLLTFVLGLEEKPAEKRATRFSETMGQIGRMRTAFFPRNQRLGWGDPLLIKFYRQCIGRAGGLGGTFWTRARAKLHILFFS